MVEKRVHSKRVRTVAPWCRPPFRWAGSKRKLVPVLLEVMPQSYGTYVEPFAGSACLFFAERPRRAVLGDFNDELVRAYQVLARHPRLIARRTAALEATPERYYQLRSLRPESLDDVERAVRFYYLNRYSFNGVYRTNRSGDFNVPFGSRPGQLPTEAEVYRASIALRAATVMSQDFVDTLGLAERGDVAYVDPPYTSVPRRTYGEYGYGAFGQEDLARLVTALHEADARGVMVLLSYKEDQALVEALHGWHTATVPVVRQVGSGATRKRQSFELLASNALDLSKVGVVPG